MKRALLLGCGSSRERKFRLSENEASDFSNFELVTIDMDPDCKPSHVWDLSVGLPTDLGSFDEIHAYDSLEHWGVQGDWQGWIKEMEQYHDHLRPGGRFFAIVPIGDDMFVDPGHVRFFGQNYFTILSNAWYEEQAAKGNHVGDYRWYRKKDWKIVLLQHIGVPLHHLVVALQKA